VRGRSTIAQNPEEICCGLTRSSRGIGLRDLSRRTQLAHRPSDIDEKRERDAGVHFTHRCLGAREFGLYVIACVWQAEFDRGAKISIAEVDRRTLQKKLRAQRV